jgi:hypothetical protein
LIQSGAQPNDLTANNASDTTLVPTTLQPYTPFGSFSFHIFFKSSINLLILPISPFLFSYATTSVKNSVHLSKRPEVSISFIISIDNWFFTLNDTSGSLNFSYFDATSAISLTTAPELNKRSVSFLYHVQKSLMCLY